MEEALSVQPAQLESNGRSTWHKPELQRLVVTLDTGAVPKPGSAADGPGAFDRLVGGFED